MMINSYFQSFGQLERVRYESVNYTNHCIKNFAGRKELPPALFGKKFMLLSNDCNIIKVIFYCSSKNFTSSFCNKWFIPRKFSHIQYMYMSIALKHYCYSVLCSYMYGVGWQKLLSLPADIATQRNLEQISLIFWAAPRPILIPIMSTLKYCHSQSN